MTIAEFVRGLEKVSCAFETRRAVQTLMETSDAVNKYLRLVSVPNDVQRELARASAAAEAVARIFEQKDAAVNQVLALERTVQRLSCSVPELPRTFVNPRIPQGPRRLDRSVERKRRTIVRPEVKRRIGF